LAGHFAQKFLIFNLQFQFLIFGFVCLHFNLKIENDLLFC
jgi:hypothetical protein